MSKESAIVDYSGRTVDLLLLKTVLDAPVVNKRVGIDVSNVHGAPMIVAGVEKLVQRFALSFLNILGSTNFRDDHGTGIVEAAGMGRIYNMATLEAEASEANMLAKAEVQRGDEESDSPDDERLADSEVVGLEFSRSQSAAKISIRLTTEAGNSYTYIIPVAVGVS